MWFTNFIIVFNCPESEVKETFETSCGQPNQISTNDPSITKQFFVWLTCILI